MLLRGYVCKKFMSEMDKPMLTLGACFGKTDAIGIIVAGTESAGSITSNLDRITKAGFQVIGRYLVQTEVFLLCTKPHSTTFVILPVIGFVPYLPVFNAVLESVSPTLVVVADNVLADPRPLVKILGRIDSVCLHTEIVLNSHAETEKWLYVVLYKRCYQPIGKGEIVGLGQSLVRIEIPKNVGNIDETVAAECTAHVVQT